jgi:hypothetical protein
MNNLAGYLLKLSPGRQETFKNNEYEMFAEPVPEFSHSRYAPLICFLIDENNTITHIALGKRGVRAGTDLRRLNLRNIYLLKRPVSLKDVTINLPNRFSDKIYEKTISSGLLPPKTFELFINAVSNLAPDTKSILSVFSASRSERIRDIDKNAAQNLAEQKEAVATAISISGLDRDKLKGWDISEGEEVTSFLDGLEQVRLREDPMVIHDLSNIPGYDLIRSTKFSSTVFKNNSTKLTVVLANRLPLEEQLGVDLIYFNETFSCFIMVQYKAMEGDSEAVFRIPKEDDCNDQLVKEIKRMDQVNQELSKFDENNEPDGYRLNQNPFFLKICPRISFEPDNTSLIKGMYLPLDYWKLISKDESMEGPRKGRRLTYSNVRRYINNTDFISMVSGGWIGTNIKQSKLLEIAIRSTLDSGRSVVFATSSNVKN